MGIGRAADCWGGLLSLPAAPRSTVSGPLSVLCCCLAMRAAYLRGVIWLSVCVCVSVCLFVCVCVCVGG